MRISYAAVAVAGFGATEAFQFERDIPAGYRVAKGSGRCAQELMLLDRPGITAVKQVRSSWLWRESFNSKIRDELLNGEIFYTLEEARVINERWRRHYNTVRPLGYKPPAPEALQWPASQPGPPNGGRPYFLKQWAAHRIKNWIKAIPNVCGPEKDLKN